MDEQSAISEIDHFTQKLDDLRIYHDLPTAGAFRGSQSIGQPPYAARSWG